MALQIQFTKDQSHTLYVPELDETYHSRNGAVEESTYVYIGKGLTDWFTINQKQTVYILEIGFGTGLNAWFTALTCAKLNIHCMYHTLETQPLSFNLVSQLNYTTNSSENDRNLFTQLHQAEWNQEINLTKNFTLHKTSNSLQTFVPTSQYDIVYFDAFAPEKQPELWTRLLFEKIFDTMEPNGIIVTYSSKGDIKRMWKEIGFNVERLPGPPMKRHMLRGTKPC